jgi:hypothetical protein
MHREGRTWEEMVEKNKRTKASKQTDGGAWLLDNRIKAKLVKQKT